MNLYSLIETATVSQNKKFFLLCEASHKRKNFLFAHSVAGANALCVHFSLIRTAKQHGLDPYRYYEAILKAVPHCHSVEDYEALLPWNMTSEAGAVSARAA